MMSQKFTVRFKENLQNCLWLLGALCLLQGLVGIRSFWVREEAFPTEVAFMPISILFWSTWPMLVVALVKSIQAKWTTYFGLFVQWGIGVIALALFVLENYLLSSYKSLYTDSIAVNILATNPGEASGFIEVIPPMYLIVPLIVGLLILITCYYLINRIADKISKTVLVVLYLVPFLLLIPLKIYTTTKGDSYNFMSPIERLYYGTLDSLKDNKAVEEVLAKMKATDFGPVESTDLGKINVVFIMGESLRRDYMHCYGYPLKNTPYIDSMVHEGSMVLFSNALAPAPSTIDAVKANISLHSLESKEHWYEYPTLMSLFSRAGYFTYWLSNQEKQGGYIAQVAAMAEMADSTHYVMVRTSRNFNSTYDEEVVPHLIHLNQVSKPILQVVHLMGSHTAFTQRYPKEYDLYKGEDLPDKTPDGMPRRKGKVEDTNLSQYLNTIIYNDYVINKIVQSFQGEPTLILYTSDHALEVHDDPSSPEHCGHSDQPIGLRIPLMVYATSEFRAMHPEIWAKAVNAKDRKIMTDITSTSICELLGVRNQYVLESLSFFSPNYNENRRRAVNFYNRVIELD